MAALSIQVPVHAAFMLKPTSGEACFITSSWDIPTALQTIRTVLEREARLLDITQNILTTEFKAALQLLSRNINPFPVSVAVTSFPGNRYVDLSGLVQHEKRMVSLFDAAFQAYLDRPVDITPDEADKKLKDAQSSFASLQNVRIYLSYFITQCIKLGQLQAGGTIGIIKSSNMPSYFRVLQHTHAGVCMHPITSRYMHSDIMS